MKHALTLLIVLVGQLQAADAYFGIPSKPTEATGFFRLGKTHDQHHLVTPDGHAYLALGINHIDMLQQKVEGGLQVRGDEAWQRYWTQTLKPQFDEWHLTTFGYGVPAALKKKAPWFAAIPLARIEKHRSDPKREARDGYHFPDVFDPAWATEITEVIHKAATPLRDDPFIIGCFWTDTPTWDLLKTRALRGMNWVDALRALPATAPGRRAYAAFLEQRYADRLADLNTFYALAFTSLDQVRDADLSAIAVGRHIVQEDDDAFLALIAQRFYEVVGKAQRQADPNHLIFGDRYLAGDAPESVLKAAAPWIDAVAVQPGDRYSPLYPASTQFPDAEIEALHTITGKPVLICDHAISFPTAAQPRTIFEQMPDEAAAAKATADFLTATFTKPYILGYLRCQYIDRPAGFGRGLRQGILKADGTPRDAFVDVYRGCFAAALKQLQELQP
ncbi:MAG: hypothetical protein Q8M07_15775 [Prosthecobacter sp.]|nr:hypothetical protein [Prosthecobacter sp.]